MTSAESVIKVKKNIIVNDFFFACAYVFVLSNKYIKLCNGVKFNEISKNSALDGRPRALRARMHRTP